MVRAEEDFSDPRVRERALAAALEAGEEARAVELIGRMGRDGLEFSCRCYALAIAGGLVEASLACACAGFRLAVTDEPAVAARIARSDGMRGLAGFMEDYGYCKAQRTYYAPVVDSRASAEPVRALLAVGLLPARDASELLTLALRQGRVDLARVLVEGGAQLPDTMRGSIPAELKGKRAVCRADESDRWRAFATPLVTLGVLELVLEHVGDEPCPMRRAWFAAYGRTAGFARKLALIAQHASAESCEDAGAALSAMAAAGELDGVRAMLSWEDLGLGAVDQAYEAARAAGSVEAAALLLERKRRAGRGARSAAAALGLELDLELEL